MRRLFRDQRSRTLGSGTEKPSSGRESQKADATEDGHDAEALHSLALRPMLERGQVAVWTGLINAQARVGNIDPATVSTVLASGVLAPAELGQVGGWIGAKIVGAVEFIKSSLLSTIALELSLAKFLDYQVSTRLRKSGSPAEPLYIAMADVGLQKGWSGSDELPPWWYGGISYGATGSMDFLVANALGAQLRLSFDERTEGLVDSESIGEEDLARLRDEFFTHATKKLGQAIADSGVELRSPLMRHLAAAMRCESRDADRALVERHLVSNPRGAGLGTMAGHAMSGAAIGTLLANPLLGATVGALDAAGDAVITQAALNGRLRTLSKLKAQLLREGWTGNDGPSIKRFISDAYAQIGQEFRLLGADLRALADSSETSLERASAELDEWIDERVDAETKGPEVSLSGWIQAAAGLAFDEASDMLEEYATEPIQDVLRSDFPGVVESSTKFTNGAKSAAENARRHLASVAHRKTGASDAKQQDSDAS